MIDWYKKCNELKVALTISTIALILSIGTIIYQYINLENKKEEVLKKNIEIVNLREIIEKEGRK